MKPEPVPTNIQCAACGLPWQDHKPSRGKVTLSECVRLLKAELARRPLASSWTGFGNGTMSATVTNIGNAGQAKAG